MSLIIRAIWKKIMHVRGFCGNARNMRSHYETLRISPGASQREIRLAFIKLSKEMHPDTSKKTNHSDFVKISEAYNVLSKPHTKHQYDMDMQFRKASEGRRVRVVYYDHERHSYRGEKMHGPFDPSDPSYVPYGVRAANRFTNVTIAMFCLLLSAIGFAAQMLLVNRSMAFRRDELLAISKKHQEAYAKVRADAERLTKEEQIAAFEERSAASRAKLVPQHRS